MNTPVSKKEKPPKAGAWAEDVAWSPKTPFVPGNQLWKLGTPGRPKFYEAPEDLWAAACKYFDWVEANPLIEVKLVSYEDASRLEDVPKLRPMTFNGLYLHLNISDDTYVLYRKRPEFKEVTNAIDMVIREQKFAGAAAGLFHPLIISRDIGLIEKTEATTTINKGTGWEEIFAQVGNRSRSLELQPIRTITHDSNSTDDLT